MKRMICGLMAAALVSFVGVAAQADERAKTNDLPAALSALNVANAAVVSTADAEQVRGQGGGILIFGHAAGNTSIISGVLLQLSGKVGGNYVNAIAAGNHVSVWAGRRDLTIKAHGKYTNTNIDFAGKFRFKFVWPSAKLH